MRKRLICLLLVAVMLLGIVPVLSLPVKAESDLTTSDALIDVLIAFEGFTGVCVVDTSQRSVGYGTRCDVCDPNMPGYLDPNRKCAAYNETTPITREHAMALKRKYLDYFENKVNSFADRYGLTFTQQQFDALISFTYNCGEGWMLESYDPEGNFRRAITSGDTGDFLVYAFGLWSKSGNTVSLGHIRRRMIEAQIYLDGVYDSSGWPANLRYVYLDGNGGQTRYYYQTFKATEVCPFRTEFTAVPKDAAGADLTFAGWFTKPEGGVEVKDLTGAITNGMILYAHWKNAAGEIVTVGADHSTSADVQVIVPNWYPNTLYEGPGTYYSEVRKTYINEQLHITKTVIGKDGNNWGYCTDGWIPLSHTNYDSVINSASPNGVWYQITATDLNVRTGPGSNYALTGGKKNPGDQILVVETQENTDANQTWAKMTDGYWVCIRNGETSWAFVMDPQPPIPEPETVTGTTITSIAISSLPVNREYEYKGRDVLPNLTGGELLLRYSNGVTRVVAITRSMVSGFDNTALGTNTITVTCGGQTTSFTVEIVPTEIVGIAMQSLPSKTEYAQGSEMLDVSGATLLVSYNMGASKTIPITAEMVSGFDNTTLGAKTLTVTYNGYTTTFEINVVKPTVTFLNYDGSVISQIQYAIGEAVTPPADPVRPADDAGAYVFAGWDKEIVACAGAATYTATYTLKPTVTFLNFDGSIISQVQYFIGETVTVPSDPVRPPDAMGEYVFAGWDKTVVACAGTTFYTATYELRYTIGDLDRNDKVDENDAIYLLRHVLFPDKYTIHAWADFDADGQISEADAIYLLRHVLFPEKYPLKTV
ncbi:MAG: bacterial Ig-like domain-containing protein [Oscillospiraceae bacterium]|nr:bacterial Ig-like domain-containing protein [Oscillospiraceae bacterium]